MIAFFHAVSFYFSLYLFFCYFINYFFFNVILIPFPLRIKDLYVFKPRMSVMENRKNRDGNCALTYG